MTLGETESGVLLSSHTSLFTDGVNGEQSLFLHFRTFHLKLQTFEQQTEICPQGCKQHGEISYINRPKLRHNLKKHRVNVTYYCD